MADYSLGEAALGTIVDLEGLNKGIDDAEDKARSGFGRIGDIIGGALKVGLAVAAGGILALGGAFISGLGDARAHAQVMAQTEAVIESTGGAAGVTAEQIEEMAGSLSAAEGKSLFGDDDIQAGQNMLLTFTNISETLPEATQTLLDMSEALDTMPADQAVALGKALNDPIAGISALSRVGVTFTDQQKEQIRTMQEAGNMAGAQRIILAELNREFGGSALAAARADGGVAQFKDRLGEMAESLATRALPFMGVFFGFLNDRAIPILEQGLTQAIDFITTTAIPAFSGAWTSAQPILQTVGSLLGSVGGVLQTVIPQAVAIALPIVAALTATFSDASTPVEGLIAVLGQISPTFSLVLSITQAVLPQLQSIVTSVFGIIGGFISEHGAKIQSDLTGAWQQIQGLINAVLPPIQMIVMAIFGAIAGFLHSHGDEIRAFLGQTWDQIASIISVAIQLIQAIIVPVLTFIAGFINSHGTEIQALLSNTWTAISAVISGTLDLIKGIITAALQIIQGDFSGAWETIKSASASFVQGLLTAIGAGLDNLKVLFGGAVEWIIGKINGLPGAVAGVGGAIVDAIRSGFERAWEGFMSMVNGLLQGLRDQLPFSEPKDPRSPLRHLDKSGMAIVGAIQEGMAAAGALVVPGVAMGAMAALPGNMSMTGGRLGTPTSAGVHITIDDRGMGLLRDLIRVEVRAETGRISGNADRRGRTR